VLPMRRYHSANKNLAKLDDKSRLFLVTVRPPSEALWLVAVLEDLRFDKTRWNAAKNRYPVTELGASIRAALKFDSGKGLQARPGALGMSLQTPRVLTSADATTTRVPCRVCAASVLRGRPRPSTRPAVSTSAPRRRRKAACCGSGCPPSCVASFL
jgi:hypothetical protein